MILPLDARLGARRIEDPSDLGDDRTGLVEVFALCGTCLKLTEASRAFGVALNGDVNRPLPNEAPQRRGVDRFAGLLQGDGPFGVKGGQGIWGE
ncbi:hypothetical protein FHS39_000627 [Streptomyces olivoverticillatus]|uniref:Uncharacterized protein n=1 Tax=Streptomyces olivoverticillatus TaxID=66427 RepID=A0A7W7LK03_9ACTN|nr:hypothetical protein [Streptomyces olivoverticillatus]